MIEELQHHGVFHDGANRRDLLVLRQLAVAAGRVAHAVHNVREARDHVGVERVGDQEVACAHDSRVNVAQLWQLSKERDASVNVARAQPMILS